MVNVNCIIVDDEPLAQNVLEKYILRVPSLKLIEKLDNAIDTISFLHDHNIDLIFLDINMPELSGLQMLKTLQNPPMVILTTAYSEYGVESYEHRVVDYLLKPIPFDRFLKAINKVIELKESKEKNKPAFKLNEVDHIFLKEDYTNHKVSFNDIIYIQAYGNYLKVFTLSRQIVIRKTISEFEKDLPKSQFIRIHKSYIVSLVQVKAIEGNRVILNNNEKLPVGKLYKLNFENSMK